MERTEWSGDVGVYGPLHGEVFSEPEARNTSTGVARAFLRAGGSHYRDGEDGGSFLGGWRVGGARFCTSTGGWGGLGGLVGVEPVGGGAVACGEFYLAVIDALHLVDDDALDAVELAGDDVEVEFVMHL